MCEIGGDVGWCQGDLLDWTRTTDEAVTPRNSLSKSASHDDDYADLVQTSPDITPVCSSFLDCCALVIPFEIHDTVVFARG